MTNLVPVPSFDDVPQIEVDTALLGGPGGPLNAQAQALLNYINMVEITTDDKINNLEATLNAPSGSGVVGYDPTIDAIEQGSVGYKFRSQRDSRDVSAVSNGSVSATSQIQNLLNFSGLALYYRSQNWTGEMTGGAIPSTTIAPGRYKSDGTNTMYTDSTFGGSHPPANTVGSTRILVDSTGITPARRWTASTKYSGNSLQPTTANGFYYAATTSGISGVTEPVWPTIVAATVVDGTVTWTCHAVSAGDNRNKPIIKFNRGTMNGAALANVGCCVRLYNLEFGMVTLGNDFNNPFGGNGIGLNDYPNGACLYFDVDHIDSRIDTVIFQHSSAGLRGRNVPAISTIRGDGFSGNSGINLFVTNSEFDAAAIHQIWENCNLDLEFNNTTFFGGGSYFKNCTGRVVFNESCRFYGGAFIDASDPSNNFTEFVCKARIEQSTLQASISVFGAKFLDLSPQMRGASGLSSIVAIACTGGSICPTVQDSGYNAAPGTVGNDFVAAIKTIGCQDVLVRPVIGTVATGGSWNGFGVLSLNGSDAPVYGTAMASSVILDPIITATYGGTVYRGQNRNVNKSTGDQIRTGSQAARPGELRSTLGLYVSGIPLVDRVLLGSAASTDLSTLITEDGAYIVMVETQLLSDTTKINAATFMVYRSGTTMVLQQLALSNPQTGSGIISMSGTSVSYSYTIGSAYYVTIRMNRLGDGGV